MKTKMLIINHKIKLKKVILVNKKKWENKNLLEF